jgi:histidyl-tRNA synthetase
MEYTMPKGVFDVLPNGDDGEWNRSDHWQYVEEVMRQIAHEFGFKEIRTPIFEKTELFVRAVGEVTDVVSKEMYTFLDKAERSLSLRPEGTAPVIRSFIENRLDTVHTLHKYYYIGPMFRYERPQAGRYRQFYHFGAEVIGNGSPEQDVEVIDMLWELYTRLGLTHLTIMINSVGNEASRARYKAALSDYLQQHLSELSPESQTRFSKNILRILDSKDPKDAKILEKAPSLLEYLDDESSNHFNRVLELLKKLNLPFEINPKLVRGLDYYNKTVFEIAVGELGAQNAIVGGGRYDGLVAALGGQNLPSIGFATGIERLLQTLCKQKIPFPPAPHPLVFIISLGQETFDFCFDLLHQLRQKRISSEMDLSGKKLQHGLQLANALKATFCLIIGQDELTSQKINLKNMATRENLPLPILELIPFLLAQKEPKN